MWAALQPVHKAGLNSNWQPHKLTAPNGHPYYCYFILCPKFRFLTSSLKTPYIWHRVIYLQDKCLLISCYPIYNRRVIQPELSGLKGEFSVRPRGAPSINSPVQAASTVADAVALRQKPRPQPQGRCKSNRTIARKYHPHLQWGVNTSDHALTVKKEEFVPKKLDRESLLMPPKPSAICKGYTFLSPPEHKEQISTFMKSDLYIAPGEWKNEARIEADLCERGSTQCVHWLSRLVLDSAQRGYLSLQTAELFRKGVLPWKHRCTDNMVQRQQKSCLGTFQ